MSLAEVLHQRRAHQSLQRAIRSGRVPHAYLFHGPDGVGKETLAVAFGQLLLCPNPALGPPSADPKEDEGRADPSSEGGRFSTVTELRQGCGQCEDCAAVRAGTHPDLHLIYRQLGREHPDADVRKRKALEIGVDVLRHFVINRVGLTPMRGRAKVFIVREADRMNVAAQNALLKTLEEPPGDTVIVLLVTSLGALLATTLSRCQIVPFDPLPEGFISERLGELRPRLSVQTRAWCGRIGEGSIGRALRAADDDWFGLHARVSEQLGQLARLRPEAVTKCWTDESKALAERYAKLDPDITDTEASRRGLQTIFQLAASWYDDQLQRHCLATVGQAASDATRPPTEADAVRRLVEAEQQLDLNVNTQLCVEVLVNDLAALAAVRVPALR